MKKHALIFGATGLIGSHLTKLLLEESSYDKVTVISRKTLAIKHEKLNNIIYDFEKPIPEHFAADHIYCCLGTTIKKAGSKEKFYRIDHDYAVDSANYAFDNGAKLFSLVSAAGANSKSSIFYNRVKGEVENNIRKIGYPGLHIYQPSLLLGERNEFRFGERIAQVIMQAFSVITPKKYRGVEALLVAEAMLGFAKQYPEKQLLVKNEAIIGFKNLTNEK